MATEASHRSVGSSVRSVGAAIDCVIEGRGSAYCRHCIVRDVLGHETGILTLTCLRRDASEQVVVRPQVIAGRADRLLNGRRTRVRCADRRQRRSTSRTGSSPSSPTTFAIFDWHSRVGACRLIAIACASVRGDANDEDGSGEECSSSDDDDDVRAREADEVCARV